MTAPHQSAMSPAATKGSTAPLQHQHAQPGPSSTSYPPQEGTARRYNGTASTRTTSNPRNMQGQRKLNKSHRKPRLHHDDDDDTLAEQSAVRAPGSRRGQTSITHLMSFALPPRPSGTATHLNRSQRRNITWGIGSGYHATDKARYIHANYRFVVDPRKDYSEQLNNSDTHLDWDDILQVLAALTTDTSCPICLSMPVAPRMAKCGHIFCLPCMIRFLHATDEHNTLPERRRRWKPCPICYDSIFMHEMKPVRWTYDEHFQEPKEGHDVVLRLLMRRAGSILALPRDIAVSSTYNQEIPWHFDAEVLDFAHLIRGSETYMREHYKSEIDALETQEKEDELFFGEDTTWSQKAITSVLELKEKAKSIGNPEFGTTKTHDSEISSPGHDNTPFYFYQGPLHSYLSPLDIRILKANFGDFSSFPSTLLPRVEHITTGNVVDEETRRRVRYLSHLPLGREIIFLECDWTDIVPAAILATFGMELEKRRNRNQEKAAREEKARLRAEQNEDKKLYGNRRQRDASLADMGSYHSLHEQSEGPSLSTSADLTAPSTSPPWHASAGRQMSSFTTLASPSTSPSGARTVWGTPIVTPLSPQLDPAPQVLASLAEHDGWLQDWERDLLDEDDLVDQAKALSVAHAGRAASSSISQSDANKMKKKKKTKITLMSTNGRRAA